MRILCSSLSLIIALIGCSKNGEFDTSQIEGDGQFEITGKNFINKGYVYYFDEFPLSQEYDETYTFRGLPDISKDFLFAVKILGDLTLPHDELLANAHLEIRLLNKEEDVIFSASSPIHEWVLSESRIDSHFYLEGEQASKLSSVEYSEDLPYTLKLKWRPASELQVATSGRLEIRSGGSY